MSDPRTIPTSQPSDRPSFTVLVNGTAIPAECHVASVVVTRVVNRIPFARITLLDGDASQEDFPLSTGDLFVPGKEVEIQAGYHSHDETIFKGIITRHAIRVRQGGGSILTVECRNKAVKLTVGRKNACFRDKKDSDVFGDIVGHYSLSADAAATDVTHKELVQYGSTDWDFMVSRAEANGMVIIAGDDKIAIDKPQFSSKPVLTLLYGATLLELDAEMDARTQYSSVKGHSWDYAKQEMIEEAGAARGVQTPGNVSNSDLAGVIGLSDYILQHPGSIGSNELKAWAASQAMKSSIAKVQGRAKFIGFAGVKPGDMLELKGVGDRFNGKAWVSGVRHELGPGVWTTDAQFGLSPQWFFEEHETEMAPASGLLPGVHGLQTGVVASLEDPDGEDRVRVKLPMIASDSDGVWSRVASLDAGNKRGAFFRPEVSDEVVIGFLNDDPRNPVILGMLNSSKLPAPITASNDNHEKGFVTRSEMKVIFNDDKKSITIQTPKGKSIVIDDNSGSIILKDENNNKIELGASGITLESGKDVIIKATGDLKMEGVNIEMKASAGLKAEGSGNLELKTSGTAVLKGSMVQIN
ncbi:MAG: Phage-related baseplate assembly protein [Syntrophorhabdaceae bacterium PtaU1.Bin034]|nr:MAG: Phage-related baseplate assembly protein [Syntrophorhabdaceae bacterium PtaU1.Bin034]